MKRANHLFERIADFENLLLASQKAQRGKRFNPAIATFNHYLEAELIQLQDELQTRTYRPGVPRQFAIYDPKPRIITAAVYRDRVVHHAVCNIVEPIYERGFISDSYACRAGKGTHAAVDRLTRAMRRNAYVLQCDIRKYFPSIDHEILKALLRRKIVCAGALWLLDVIIDSGLPQGDTIIYFPGDDLFSPYARERGLPIGNQTSQFFANVYLDPLDHYMKETLGIRDYLRYCDDFLVLANEKRKLWQLKDAIEAFLASRLRLLLHPTRQWVRPVVAGVDFLGYRIFPTHRRLLRASGYRFQRNLRRMQKAYRCGAISSAILNQRIAAWLGHARHADTYGLRTALLGKVVFRRVATREPACCAAAPGTMTIPGSSARPTGTGMIRGIGTTI
jgi:retron-type reverse transcriptase